MGMKNTNEISHFRKQYPEKTTKDTGFLFVVVVGGFLEYLKLKVGTDYKPTTTTVTPKFSNKNSMYFLSDYLSDLSEWDKWENSKN